MSLDSIKYKSVYLKSKTKSKLNVLLSYLVYPFLVKDVTCLSKDHSNHWECHQIAQTFLDLGYNVEVINWDNNRFIPKKKYSFFIDIHSNLKRLSPFLNPECIKILHITGSHWLFQNQAEYQRLTDLQGRKGVCLLPRRQVEPCNSIEICDFATIIGNNITQKTFAYANKKLYRLNVSATVEFEYNETKNWEDCRKNFLWLGSSGMVHKGLDLILEAFCSLSKYNLYICGPIKNEPDFEKSYYKELYQTANIRILGWTKVDSVEFKKLTSNCIGIIYPSCSEGQAGSVVQCLHAGLIPIISIESGIDTNDFGVTLTDCNIQTIIKAIKETSQLPSEKLAIMSKKSWDYARSNHTRQYFARRYKEIISSIKKN